MKHSKRLRPALLAAAVAAGAACLAGVARNGGRAAFAGPAVSASESQQRGVTKPSEESNLAFAGPGVVGNVAVKAGDEVKSGQVVANQDEREEQAKLAMLKLAADSDLEIQAGEADAALKKVELGRKEKLYADLIKQGKSNSELDDARLQVKVGEIIVLARREAKQKAQLEYAVEQVMLAKKQLTSPIDGVIARVDIHPGDGIDLTKPAMQVVRNDPLWVEVDVPSGRAKALAAKQTLQVRYTDEDAWMPAEIIFLTPVANAGSNTRRVRLQLPNPSHREAGLPIVLQLPENLASAK